MSDEEYMSDIEEYFDDDDEMGEGEGTGDSDGGAMEEDDEYVDDIKVEPLKDKLRVYETEYESLDTKGVERLIHKEAEDIMGIFDIDVSTDDYGLLVYALSLLRCGRWIRPFSSSARCPGTKND